MRKFYSAGALGTRPARLDVAPAYLVNTARDVFGAAFPTADGGVSAPGVMGEMVNLQDVLAARAAQGSAEAVVPATVPAAGGVALRAA